MAAVEMGPLFNGILEDGEEDLQRGLMMQSLYKESVLYFKNTKA